MLIKDTDKNNFSYSSKIFLDLFKVYYRALKKRISKRKPKNEFTIFSKRKN